MVSGAVRESNPRPLAPEARIIPLDQRPSTRARAEAVPSLPPAAVPWRLDTTLHALRPVWAFGLVV